MIDLGALTAGLLTGLTLIVAIGAQNAYVLRQGLRREHVGAVVVVCALSDVVLVVAGVAGIGVLVERAPAALVVVRWLGVGFLTAYGLMSLWRARSAAGLRAATSSRTARRGVVARAIALTWLNPHVYLDTVLLLGSLAATRGPGGRWWFGAGAMVASVVWFVGLGLAARAAQRLLAAPRAWQVLEVLIGTTMLVIAHHLARG
ncbi:MAG TPA: LysE family transporter [Ornithinibacter sp.]|nr:LysE family transporter [Ornithinibacter sp.]